MPRHFNITVNGIDYQVDVEELNAPAPAKNTAAKAAFSAPSAPATAPAAPAQAAAPAAGSGTDVVAQMGGAIAKILVKQGQSVSTGDRLIELEAMKMKIPVLATCNGQVTRILVAEGEPVEIGQALITIG